MEKEWYLSFDDQRIGPIGIEELRDRIKANPDQAKNALVWSEGMPDWVSPESAGVLQEAQSAPAISPGVSQPVTKVPDDPAILTKSEHNPYQPPQTTSSEVDGPKYPGINRLTYFLSVLGLIILMGVIFAATLGLSSDLEENPFHPAMFGIIAVAVVGGVILGVQRIRNVGKSGWWYLTILIPIYNIWTQIVLTAAPTGYEDKGEFDTAGKVIAGLYIAYLVLNFILSISGAAG